MTSGARGVPEAKAIPPERRSHQFEITEYDVHQERLRQHHWTLDGVPFYRGKGQVHDPFDWHNFDYLDAYHRIYGRECGAAGIGKLREVGLVRVSADDDYGNHPYVREDPDYLVRDGFDVRIDVGRLRDEQMEYAAILESVGVKVYWIEYPQRPMAAFGPMTNQHSAAELMVVPGGSIIPKKGYALAPLSGFGRTEYLARWAFWNLGIPPLLTVAGKGVWIAGLFLADDVYVQTLGVETNREGLEQIVPVLKRVCGERLHVRLIHTPGTDYFDRRSGANAHTDMIIAPLDVDKVLVYSAGIDTETHIWLRKAGYKVIEVDYAEHLEYCPCNLIPLEPRRVVMHAGAKRTIAAVQKAGLDVIPVPYTEYNKFGGGIHCATMQILRGPGPRHFSG